MFIQNIFKCDQTSVRLFHKFVILERKQLFRTLSQEYDLANFRLCPLVMFCLHGCKYGVAAISYIPLTIFYVSIMSPLSLLFTRVGKSRLSQSFLTGQMQAVVAISVEALVCIVIGRSCSKGCGFDSHYRLGSFLIFNSRPIMYGAVDSMVLSQSWTRQSGFISFRCLWIQLCNNVGQRLCAYNLPQLTKLSILSGSVNWYRQ